MPKIKKEKLANKNDMIESLWDDLQELVNKNSRAIVQLIADFSRYTEAAASLDEIVITKIDEMNEKLDRLIPKKKKIGYE